ncbi:MAG TPA: methyltransferase [Candidatus Binataceae bacterium]|nr:methyltransferase [Candidatus Binataceae bacterium]
MITGPAETLDAILGGTISIVQPAKGYRFAVDSILLGRFAQPAHGARVLELGAGSGVVAVMLAALRSPREVAAVEIQPQLAAMISRNASLNGIARLTAICADIRERNVPGLAPGSFDYVVANPPYRSAGSGRESPLPGRRIARGADGAALHDFIAAAARYAKNGGKLALVFTAARTAELITELKGKRLEPKRIRFVHPLPGRPATIVLMEARKGGRVEVKIEPPLLLYDRPGAYSNEARDLLGRAK